MNMQVTSKMARFGTRLVDLGRRHREVEDRIASVKEHHLPDPFALRQLNKQRQRLKNEMQCYEELLRSLTRTANSPA